MHFHLRRTLPAAFATTSPCEAINLKRLKLMLRYFVGGLFCYLEYHEAVMFRRPGTHLVRR
jgi:hypothetical protein